MIPDNCCVDGTIAAHDAFSFFDSTRDLKDKLGELFNPDGIRLPDGNFAVGQTAMASGTTVYIEQDSPSNSFCQSVNPMDYFQYLCEMYPIKLKSLVKENRLDASELSFAAEYLGRIEGDPEIVELLLDLLGHSKAYVREGALYGLYFLFLRITHLLWLFWRYRKRLR